MNPLGLSDAAMQAIIESYRYFDVRFDEFRRYSPFCVVGYRGRLWRFLRLGSELFCLQNADYAWLMVYLLRACKSGQDLNQRLQHMGIQCPVSGEGGDVHG